MSTQSRREFLGWMGAGIMTASLSGYAEDAAAPAADGIIGHGTHRYRVVKGWGALDPEKYPVRDCHGMVQDGQGRIILLTNHTKNNVIFYDKAGNLLHTWGTKYPGAHGLSIVKEGDTEFLFITDHDLHKVFKTTLEGEEVMTLDFPLDSGFYTGVEQYKPTQVAIAPSGDFFVCDGYGQFYVMKYDKPGKLLKAFGGPETMNTPHGACIDTRNPSFPELVVAVRGKKELHRYSLDGEALGIIEMPGAEVCTAFVFGQEMYVPNLNGYISILDKDNKVISNPGGTAPDYTESGRLRPMEKADETFVHPHGIMVDDEGDVYVPQWNSGNTYPIKLARLRES
jgi:peptidylamidoglycolate lyase